MHPNVIDLSELFDTVEDDRNKNASYMLCLELESTGSDGGEEQSTDGKTDSVEG
jgi:hypothetical protein